jgi:hypothetical protein
VVTPTDRHTKPEAADKVHRTQRNVRHFFIQPASTSPPRPPAEPVPAPRLPVKHARAISDFFIQPAAPRPPAEPDPAPRPLRSKLHHAPGGAGPCTPTSFCTSTNNCLRCLSNCDSEHNPTTNRRGFTWSRPQFEQPGRKPMSIHKLPSPTFGRALFGPLPSLSFYVHWRSRSMNGDQFLDSEMASTPCLTLNIFTCTLSLSAEVCNCTV